jgi:hypothetical protein
MVTFEQEDIKKLFEYLNAQPYKFSAPIFEFFYQKMNKDKKEETAIEVEKPKKVKS